MPMYRAYATLRYVTDIKADSLAEARILARDTELACYDFDSTEYEVREILSREDDTEKLRRQVDVACEALRKITTLLRTGKYIEAIDPKLQYQVLPSESVAQALAVAADVLSGMALKSDADARCEG